MQHSIHIAPDLPSLAGLGAKSRAAERALEQALAAGLKPVAPDHSVKAASVYLSDALESALAAWDKDRLDDPAVEQLATELVWAWTQRQRALRRSHAAKKVKREYPIDGLRPEQVQLIDQILSGFGARGLVFSEASTGVGKSRALALIGEHERVAGRTVTLVTPTVKLVAQLVKEFAGLGLPAPAVYLGRGQFVDPDLLRGVLADAGLQIPAEERAAIEDWMLHGAAAMAEHTRELAQGDPELTWLADDLEAVAPSVPRAMVVSKRGAHPTYDAMRARWQQAPVRITTHALLAQHVRLSVFKHPLIYDLGVVLVDEAHALFGALRDAFTGQLSLFSLYTRIKAFWASADTHGCFPGLSKTRSLALRKPLTILTETTLALLNEIRDTTHGEEFYVNTRKRPLTADAQQVMEAVQDAAGTMLPLLNLLHAQRLQALDGVVKEAIDAIKWIQADKTFRLRLSPKCYYPSIETHGWVPTKPLVDFWGSVGRSALVSGTLYVDTADHGVSAGLFLQRLRMPEDRVRETPQVTTKWLYTVPVLHIPEPQERVALIPPKAAEGPGDQVVPVADARYFKAVTEQCLRAAGQAYGGALVLCTSHTAVRRLTELLEPVLGKRLVAQDPNKSFSSWVTAFRARGSHPVGVATGPAWTGLDLRDETTDAEHDLLLTDLVIPRLPVYPEGLYPNTREQRLDVAIRFRQGIGRLMRAAGQQHRNLWVLDGRLWSDDRHHRFLTEPCRRVLERYEHTVVGTGTPGDASQPQRPARRRLAKRRFGTTG